MKLAIIEDQAMLRELLLMACVQAFPSTQVQSAPNIQEGLELCRQLQPTMVLLDVVLPDGDGLNSVPAIRAVAPGTKIIALSSHTDEYTLHRAQLMEVQGFVDKNGQTLEILQEAISSVNSGHSYTCSVVREMRTRMRADPLAFNKVLSDREMELLCLFGQGWSNEEVATHAALSPRTARNHRQNIMTKLRLSSTPQLIRYALEKGFAHGPHQ